MRGTWLALAALVGCGGDDLVATGSFEIVGHSDLGARGMNAALAVAGDTVYVGARNDRQPILIVDVADPAAPAIVGEVPGLAGMSQRELRAVPDLNLLVVLSMQCSTDLHACMGAGEVESLKLYDIADRRAPALVATYPIRGTNFFPRGPHEFYLHRDESRVLLFVAAPGASPSLEVVDVSDPRAPVKVTTWDPRGEGLVTTGPDDILHSVTASRDGAQLYISHQLSGLLVADASALPDISLMTPPAAALDFSPPGTMGPHSAVPVPGRDVLIVTEEVYPMPFGTGCPWGHLRTVDVSNPAAPALLAELGVPENDPATCATRPAEDLVAFTAHNTTATHDLALVTWYAAGLQAIDISDPAAPRRLTELRPEPLPAVAVEDPYLAGNGVEMWSYPVIQGGLIYVVDVRNGLYILRYHGQWSEQIADEDFLEGNSNL
jgi:hypothetical protein